MTAKKKVAAKKPAVTTAPVDGDPQSPDVVHEEVIESTAVALFNLAEHIDRGFAFVRDLAGWNVKTPEGEHGHGVTPEAAVLNVGSTIIPNHDGQRELHRRNGTVILLDTESI